MLTIVGDVPAAPQDAPSSEPQGDTTPEVDASAAWGPVQRALQADIAQLEESSEFGRGALVAAALSLAKDIDDPTYRLSKGPLVKHLSDVIGVLRGKAASDGESLEELLAGLAEPVTAP